MDTPKNTIIDIEPLFSARGIHLTSKRKAIWNFFANNPQGHSIAQTAECLKSHGIGQATVYRSVLILLELGLLHRIQDKSGKTLFVAVRPGHTHPLVCRECFNTVEFDSCDLSILEKLLNSQTGYSIEGHHLEIYGVCPKCKINVNINEKQSVQS